MNRFRADLVLLFVTLIWGSAFAVQRVAAQHFDAFTFNGLRFLLGGLVLLPFSKLLPIKKKQNKTNSPKSWRKWNIRTGSEQKVFHLYSSGRRAAIWYSRLAANWVTNHHRWKCGFYHHALCRAGGNPPNNLLERKNPLDIVVGCWDSDTG
jgi:hypothetical protein